MLKAVIAIAALAAVALGLALPTPHHAEAGTRSQIFAFEAGRA